MPNPVMVELRRSARGWVLTPIALALSAATLYGQTAPITVFPTRVTITPQVPSGSVQLKNEGATEARFQVTAHAWSTSSSGEMQLAPTDDLVVFPTVFALKPGEARSVRIGSKIRADQRERPYRIVVEELANTADTTPASGVQMLRRLNIPVFVQPADRQLTAELDMLAVPRPGVATLRVRNLGTTHFIVGEIALTGRAAGGATLVEAKRDGWYVLPGDEIRYEVAFDPATCAKLATITIAVRLRDVAIDPLIETLTLPPGGCQGR